jgi:hypothetical protein
MSYLRVTLGGVERGLKFNQAAVEQFSKYYDYSTTTSAVYATFYAGLVGNAIVKREEQDFTFEQVCEWVDELYGTEGGELLIKEADAVFTQSSNYKVWLAKVQGAIDKIRGLQETSDEEKKSETLTLTGSSYTPLPLADLDGQSTNT